MSFFLEFGHWDSYFFMLTSDVRRPPSRLTGCSIVISLSNNLIYFIIISLPSSGWAFSRPRRRISMSSLFFLSRNFCPDFTRVSRSCSPRLTDRRIPLVSPPPLLPARFFRDCFSNSYCSLPKSTILQTGGVAKGATSTKSSPAICASCIASLVGMMPR